MDKNKNIGFVIAVIGGIGLGLLLGNEFSGLIITIFGAIFILLSIISTIILSLNGKDDESKTDSEPLISDNDISEQSYDDRRRESKNNEEDQSIKPGSKEYEEIGDLTELSYDLRRREKKEIKYECKDCGKQAKSSDGKNPECCGKPMKQVPLASCIQPHDAEYAGPFEEDEPCDNGRAG